jgi:hypothetical protein
VENLGLCLLVISVEEMYAVIVMILPRGSVIIVKWENDSFFLQIKKEIHINSFSILIIQRWRKDVC